MAVLAEAGDVEVDCDLTLARDWGDQGHRLVGELGELHRFGGDGQASAFDARDVKHLVDELEQVPPAAEDVFHVLAVPVSQIVELEELTKPDDRVQGGPELVAHAGEELALCPVRGFGAGARSEQLGALLFGVAFRGDVLGGAEVRAWACRIWMTARVHDALVSLIGSNPVLEVEGGRPARRAGDGLEDALAVVGVDVGEQHVPERRPLRRVPAEDLVKLIGPGDL